MLFFAVVAPRIVPARDVRTGKRTSPTRASATTRSAASGSSWRGRERRKAPGPGDRRACVSGLPRSAGARPAVSARPWPSGGFDRRPRSRTRRRPGPSNSSRTRSARPVAAAIETSAGCIGPGSGWTGEPRGALAGSAGARARLAGFRERSLGGATAARPGRPVNRRATRRGRPGWGPGGRIRTGPVVATHRPAPSVRRSSTARRSRTSRASSSSWAVRAPSRSTSRKRKRVPIGIWPSRQRAASTTVAVSGWPPVGGPSPIWAIGWRPAGTWATPGTMPCGRDSNGATVSRVGPASRWP